MEIKEYNLEITKIHTADYWQVHDHNNSQQF